MKVAAAKAALTDRPDWLEPADDDVFMPYTCPEKREAWVKGSKLLAFDIRRFWCEAVVRKINGTGESRELLVHYVGWNKRWDHWVPLLSRRLRAVDEPSSSSDAAPTAAADGMSTRANRYAPCERPSARATSSNLGAASGRDALGGGISSEPSAEDCGLLAPSRSQSGSTEDSVEVDSDDEDAPWRATRVVLKLKDPTDADAAASANTLDTASHPVLSAATGCIPPQTSVPPVVDEGMGVSPPEEASSRDGFFRRRDSITTFSFNSSTSFSDDISLTEAETSPADGQSEGGGTPRQLSGRTAHDDEEEEAVTETDSAELGAIR